MMHKQKWKNICHLSIMIMLVGGFILSPIGRMLVFAEEGNQETESKQPEKAEENVESGEAEGNSGGFTVVSERVEGDMDLLGALTGQIDIAEGKITGLTITKELETGDERDPMVIQITSPGPVDLQELYTETMDGGPPEFDLIEGLCTSDTPGWACLEDVTMEVDHQTVENISLPEAKIETCFLDECDFDLPDESTADENTIETALQAIEEQQLSLEDMMDGLKDDEEKLSAIQNLLAEATDIYEQIQHDEHVEELAAVIEDMVEFFETETLKDAEEEKAGDEEEKEIDVDSKKQADADQSPVEHPFVQLTDEVHEKYDQFDDLSAEFFTVLDEALREIKQLDESISLKEQSLEVVKAEENDESVKQAKEFMAAQDINQDDDQDDDVADETSDSKDETNETEAVTIERVESTLDALKHDFDTARKTADKLEEKESELREKKEMIINILSDIKTIVQESSSAFHQEHYEIVMEHLSFVTASEDADTTAQTERNEDGDVQEKGEENHVDSNATSDEEHKRRSLLKSILDTVQAVLK